MHKGHIANRFIASRRGLDRLEPSLSRRKSAAEGGCGVIGMACSIPLPGRHLLQALRQMRNRGNGKGGGAALVGLTADEFGVSDKMLREDYLVAVAFLDQSTRSDVEREFIEPVFQVDHVHEFALADTLAIEPEPPRVAAYFVKVLPKALERFAALNGLGDVPSNYVTDEFVYRNSFLLNQAYYASLGEKRAFVLSHGKDMLVLKMVGYGDDVIRAYHLEDVHAHVWIGHHRYPTKGRVWHPGGAHPFVGLHEALVHNGDFANYASVCTYLAQQNIYPLFLTDTEVSVLVYDLLHRTYGYPLEYVIEALAPTTERDFCMLPPDKQRIYRMLQSVHMHGSPDGPWFFLIAQSMEGGGGPRDAMLVGITDTSMLRPQVFALQQGESGQPSIGFAASEKQAIDAALESLSSEDPRFWSRPDKVWNARGGSHTDGGAFIFTVRRNSGETVELACTDKFGRRIETGSGTIPYRGLRLAASHRENPISFEGSNRELALRTVDALPGLDYEQVAVFLEELTGELGEDENRIRALEVLTFLVDRRYPTGKMRRSSLLSLFDSALARVFEFVARRQTKAFASHSVGQRISDPSTEEQCVVVDARGFDHEGENSLAQAVIALVRAGYRRVIVAHAKGHRFIANGLGAGSAGVRVEVFGSSGDYLGSGLDGADVIVHGHGQDQLAQIMKDGRLVVYGDVGQTFGYAAKGGKAFVLGSAAGRPMINAVGRPRVVINGTCLDYLAESFMAGDPMNGGGFVVLNGVAFGEDGVIHDLPTPYPGGNLFSLASGGAIFLRDPHRRVGVEQLNGGAFRPFEDAHWDLIRPILEENEELLGMPVSRLLKVDGRSAPPDEVYRVVLPVALKSLQPEEAWVREKNLASGLGSTEGV